LTGASHFYNSGQRIQQKSLGSPAWWWVATRSEISAPDEFDGLTDEELN